MDASHVTQTIARWKGAIFAVAVVCALLAAVISQRMGRQYTASVTLRIRPAQLMAPIDRLVAPRPDEPSEALTPEAQPAQTQALVKTVDALVRTPGVVGEVIWALG